MKPKRYPYSGGMKHPTMTITKKPLAYIDPIAKVDYKRSNDVEFKSDGVVFNKSTIKTGSNIKPEEIPGYQEPVLKFDHKRLNAIEFKSDGLTFNRI